MEDLLAKVAQQIKDLFSAEQAAIYQRLAGKPFILDPSQEPPCGAPAEDNLTAAGRQPPPH
jgi:hypothetical protein